MGGCTPATSENFPLTSPSPQVTITCMDSAPANIYIGSRIGIIRSLAISYNGNNLFESPIDPVTGQVPAQNATPRIIIADRVLLNFPCLIMLNGLPSLVAALANATNVQVQSS